MDALQDNDPRRVGPYVLLGRLGQGGMGVVYLAKTAGDTRVALKVIHGHLSSDPDFRRRFRREVAAAQRVARFCTAPVLDADVDGNLAYMVTEFVSGPSLDQAVKSGGPLTGSSLDALAVGIAVALRAIHGAQIIHRDLKPSNVLLSPVGPKVIDFGVAHLIEGHTHSSGVVGTPSFMAPEQLRGVPISPACDVFAWGGVMAFAAGGRPPFGGGATASVLYQVIHDEPELSGLGGPLLPLVRAALAKDPADRPTPQDLLDALSAGPAGSSVPKGETTLGRVATGSGRGRLWTGVGVATAACALAAAIVVAAQSDVLGGPASSSAAGTRPATAAKGQESGPATTPPSPPTGRRPLSASGPNPLDDDDVRLFTPPNGDLSREVELKTAIGRTEDAALLRALAKVPQSVWLEGSGAVARRTVAATLKGAAKTGSVPVFVTAGIPLRDCHEHGTQSGSAYRSWISGIAAEIGDARAVVILEPNSLVKLPATNECEKGDAKAQRERFQNLAFAVREFGELSHTAVYLDGSFESWPEPSEMSRRLIQARIDEADGFFLNASNYQPTDGLVRYGNRLARCIRFQFVKGTGDCPGTEIAAVPGDPSALPHFVIDTSRNGRGEWVPDKTYPEPETWCNPPGRGVGLRPTTETGDELVDAYLWIFEPGRSNGACTRGTDGPEDPVYGKVIPYGGRFWPEMALERARLANPPLR